MSNQKRIIKRIIIILTYLFILGSIIGLFYFFQKPQETCFDSIKNQNEEAIDCGGVCSPCENYQYEELKVLNSGTTASGIEGRVDVFVQVENPNSHLGIKDINYEIRILGENNVVLGSSKGKSFFLPHEKKILIENNLEINKSEIRKIEWKPIDIKWVNFDSSFENPQLKIVNKKVDFDFSGSSVSGLLINESSYDFSLIGIKVILKDANNQIRFINSTEMRSVKSKEEREFKTIWPGRLPDDIIKVEVETEVNVFDPQSFFKGYYESQKFQELKSF